MIHAVPTKPHSIAQSLPYRKILVIKPGAIGDLLQMTPVLRGLRKAAPDSRIDLLLGSEGAAEIFRTSPSLDGTVVYDRSGRHRSLRGLLSLWKELRAKRYDLVLNFQRSNLRAWILASAAFPCRVLVYRKERTRRIHAVQNYLETLAPIGIPADDLALEFVADDEARRTAQALLHEHCSPGGPLIALNPGASHLVNRWPAARFAELTDLLTDRLRARIVIIGGTQDLELANEIAEKSRVAPLILSGRTSIPVLAAVLERCSVLVSGDTGPMHLATAVRLPVVALFGAADPDRTGPIGARATVLRAREVPCVPCRKRSCDNPRYLACMEAISAADVADAVAALLPKP